MMQPNDPVTSTVVRQRLDELFAQLQGPDRPEEVEAARERVNLGASGRPAVASQTERPPVLPAAAADAEGWLERLRVGISAESGPPVESPERPRARMAGRVLVFAKEHLATVVLVLVVSVAWAGYSVLQVRATPIGAPTPSVIASPGAPVSTAPGSVKQVVVHVIGAITKPGVVTLTDGARVADAISAAGGLSSEAAVGELNLAQVLTDGTQLKIGNRRHPGGWIRDGTGGSDGAGSTGGAASAMVSLNSATVQQLDTLPGVGPVTAQKIVDWRKAHGKFTSIGELQEVDGIGPKTYADIAPHVRL